ncbi:hypothetical protein Pyn_29366 [Prunus yedoensis var. nudiflora]|uniref:Uncharacterized protein n=1 Tax=Prunus yedoensis var. nudiflora TaxID=2094558 RepID=A0A314YFE7_PRUYE|nr:hypothetical protein Pyn_29366 [Prunus yedoensis var. nudiflora]
MSTNLSKSQNSTKACRIISFMAKSPNISTLSPPLKNRISPISSWAKNPLKLYSSSTETRPSKTISSMPRCYGKQGAVQTLRAEGDIARAMGNKGQYRQYVTGPDPNSTLEFAPDPVRVRHLAGAKHT